jgi:type 1 glutamine amidotransferase
MAGDADRIRVLGYGQEDGASQPLFWILEPTRGRVFVSIPGHSAWTFDAPLDRKLSLRGIAWAAGGRSSVSTS